MGGLLGGPRTSDCYLAVGPPCGTSGWPPQRPAPQPRAPGAQSPPSQPRQGPVLFCVPRPSCIHRHAANYRILERVIGHRSTRLFAGHGHELLEQRLGHPDYPGVWCGHRSNVPTVPWRRRASTYRGGRAPANLVADLAPKFLRVSVYKVFKSPTTRRPLEILRSQGCRRPENISTDLERAYCRVLVPAPWREGFFMYGGECELPIRYQEKT